MGCDCIFLNMMHLILAALAPLFIGWFILMPLTLSFDRWSCSIGYFENGSHYMHLCKFVCSDNSHVVQFLYFKKKIKELQKLMGIKLQNQKLQNIRLYIHANFNLKSCCWRRKVHRCISTAVWSGRTRKGACRSWGANVWLCYWLSMVLYE